MLQRESHLIELQAFDDEFMYSFLNLVEGGLGRLFQLMLRLPLHSFSTLISQLVTRYRLYCQMRGKSSNTTFEQLKSPTLIRMIERVIDVEVPIHEDLLVRRISRHHSYGRQAEISEALF